MAFLAKMILQEFPYCQMAKTDPSLETFLAKTSVFGSYGGVGRILQD